MRKLLIAAALAVALSLGACASVPTATFNDKVALSVQTVTESRKLATQLMIADKITPAKELEVQNRLSSVVSLLRTAKAIEQSDPTKASAALNQALADLAVVQGAIGAQK